MDEPVPGPANEQLAARLRIVGEHVRRENEHDLAGIMATFGDEAEYGRKLMPLGTLLQ